MNAVLFFGLAEKFPERLYDLRNVNLRDQIAFELTKEKKTHTQSVLFSAV